MAIASLGSRKTRDAPSPPSTALLLPAQIISPLDKHKRDERKTKLKSGKGQIIVVICLCLLRYVLESKEKCQLKRRDKGEKRERTSENIAETVDYKKAVSLSRGREVLEGRGRGGNGSYHLMLTHNGA